MHMGMWKSLGIPYTCLMKKKLLERKLFRFSQFQLKTCDNKKNDGMDDDMTKTIDLQVNAKNISDLKKGYPLIFKDAILIQKCLTKEGSIVRLVDKDRRFVAKGYYGVQNKGIGWVLTRKEDEAIDFDFFESKIAAALATT